MKHIVNKLKGQIPIWVGIVSAVGMVASSFITGSYGAQNELNQVRLDFQKTVDAQKLVASHDNAIIAQDNAVQDEKIASLKEDLTEIKSDLKLLINFNNTLLNSLGIKK